ncbi:glycosyltransferase family 87 protein [Streptomyces calvus]|uniref:Multisubunit Na+/H+ antiporter MnhF subunit n=1 Tax=Streptomyces calvus TaxID=67282 RepID=A0AA40VF41_9ACTN|nr:glycosyltransferase family 87 protein [Streptomyces calvus]MBA8943185.1 multisubunit Na+/H+ antiporter MnhF subunit [Streptomyces calvus]GGP35746.1 membrane protein [Streptomyces calvus]
MKTTAARGSLARLVALWALTRTALMLCVLKVVVFPGPDVTSDVSVIYRGWYDVLRTGTFPLDDITWQYPPAAALAVLSPGLLPFLEYATAFFVLALVADLVTLALLRYAGRGPGRTHAGAWVWVAGVPLLGPTVYARYDVMVTAVAVAALLAAARHPRLAGALAGFGALLKVWPALLLLGMARRRAWVSAAATGAGVAAVFAALMPGAFAFLTFQRDRGTEVESLGALVFHVARHHGWQGEVLLNYGSVEFLGPYVNWVSTGALLLSGAALAWLVLWRLLAGRCEPHTVADAAFVAVLLFTTTSRVISPQYMVWLVGLAAVCRSFRGSRMGLPVALVLAASFVTVLEFPVHFDHVVASDGLGITLLVLRNGLLVVAAVVAARRLWCATVPLPAPLPRQQAAPSSEATVSS